MPNHGTHTFYAIEKQCMKKLYLNCVEEAVFDNKVPAESVPFWIGLSDHWYS